MIGYVDKILNASWYPDICPSSVEYKYLAKMLHPDVNSDAKAVSAFAHLNELKELFERGMLLHDESGEYRSNFLDHKWMGDSVLIQRSYSNYLELVERARKNFNDQSFGHFMRYIPSNLTLENGMLTYRSHRKAIPLSHVIGLLPAGERNKHVNWIYSRLIEFVTLLESAGITHAGLNPDSILVVPETHAIKVVSFYHMCIGDVKTICGKYKNYYPQQLFDTKKAGPYIDISCIKKTAICALGDVSGAGTRLRANTDINKNVLGYLMASESDAFLSMKTWRAILDQNFVKEFVPLNI